MKKVSAAASRLPLVFTSKDDLVRRKDFVQGKWSEVVRPPGPSLKSCLKRPGGRHGVKQPAKRVTFPSEFVSDIPEILCDTDIDRIEVPACHHDSRRDERGNTCYESPKGWGVLDDAPDHLLFGSWVREQRRRQHNYLNGTLKGMYVMNGWDYRPHRSHPCYKILRSREEKRQAAKGEGKT